jgi:hypothetical protein
MTLNRHLRFPVMTKYTEKNKYDKFSLLNETAVPVNSVYLVALPDHIKITYKFMIWTELVEQLNHVIERINFAAEDYWGDEKRYRFRAYAGDYSTPIEVSDGKDRVVRCEFDLTVMGYLLPDSFEDRKPTMQRLTTPRRIVVAGESSQAPVANNSCQSKLIIKDGFVMLREEADNLLPPPMAPVDGATTLQKINQAYLQMINNSKNSNIWHPAPTNSTDYGEEGWMAYDGFFHYVYVNGTWKHRPITNYTDLT